MRVVAFLAYLDQWLGMCGVECRLWVLAGWSCTLAADSSVLTLSETDQEVEAAEVKSMVVREGSRLPCLCPHHSSLSSLARAQQLEASLLQEGQVHLSQLDDDEDALSCVGAVLVLDRRRGPRHDSRSDQESLPDDLLRRRCLRMCL